MLILICASSPPIHKELFQSKDHKHFKSLLTGSAFSQQEGNSPLMIDFNSAASSVYFLYLANLVFLSASGLAPPGMWRLQCLKKTTHTFSGSYKPQLINRKQKKILTISSILFNILRHVERFIWSSKILPCGLDLFGTQCISMHSVGVSFVWRTKTNSCGHLWDG